ncbi:MAG: allophanate hydrolase, partial [Rhodospirillales bacterium]
GSGRVPAAFCNVVGWKGTCGRVSTRGVVPACRSLDCVTVFALTAADAARVAHVAAQFDPEDPFARRAPGALAAMPGPLPQPLRLGVPNAADLAFFGNAETPALFDQAVRNLATIGAEVRTVDLHPFLEAARLLYEGPWVAERTAAVGAFLAAHPAAGDPVVRRIIEGGGRFTAVDAFTAAYRLRALKRRTEAVWSDVDVIVTPTAGTIPTLAAVTAEPVQRNSDLGYYTNFMNLLDLAAVAIPAGFQRNGLPFGVTLFAPAFRDDLLLSVGWALQQHTGLSLGATGQPLPASGPLPLEIRPPARTAGSDGIELAVFGAHMAGLPLNPQLTDRGARLVSPVATAARYRLYALQHLDPPRPGLVCDPGGGASIAGELWAVPADQLGSFLAGIEPPLAIGKVELSDGRWVTGFLCESHAIAAASDISRFGGWRAWRAAIEAAV